MTLHYQQFNKFPQVARVPVQIVLIHGWAMNSAVWSELVDELKEIVPVVVLDLPGYGKSSMLQEEYDLSHLAKSIQPVLELAEQSIVLGWSLGGMVALELAQRFSESVKQLILVGTSPRFVQGDNWPHAVEAEVFHQFADSLKQDINKTISRFMVLQMLGSDSAKQDARIVSQSLKNQGEPNPLALDKGLEILLTEDRREQLKSLTLPIAMICGSRDTLVKRQALESFTSHANIELYIMSEAGHVPFVSHFEEFYALLKQALTNTLNYRSNER